MAAVAKLSKHVTVFIDDVDSHLIKPDGDAEKTNTQRLIQAVCRRQATNTSPLHVVLGSSHDVTDELHKCKQDLLVLDFLQQPLPRLTALFPQCPVSLLE